MQNLSCRIEERGAVVVDAAVPMRRMWKREVGCDGVEDVVGAVGQSSARRAKESRQSRPLREKLLGMKSWMMADTWTSLGFAVKDGV